MAWIESHQVLERHPKVLDLKDLMGWTLDETIGKLHRFWWWCLDFAPDGQLEKFSHSVIGQSVNLDANMSAQFVQSLITAKWVDSEPCLRVHDWWEYAGRFLQVRYKRQPKMWKRIKALYVPYKQPNRSRPTTGLATTNNHKPNLTRPNLILTNQTNLTEPNEEEEKICDHPSDDRRPVPKTPGKTVPTWEAYSSAYVARWSSAPVRNETVNSILANFVRRIGAVEAPQVAAFYVAHNNPFYVSKRHPVNLLLQDCEGLRTQWATGVKATTSEARNAERKDDARAQIERVKAMMGDQ